jgi:hypothetical protein
MCKLNEFPRACMSQQDIAEKAGARLSDSVNHNDGGGGSCNPSPQRRGVLYAAVTAQPAKSEAAQQLIEEGTALSAAACTSAVAVLR